jgi:flagellar biosynthesis protein FlhB
MAEGQQSAQERTQPATSKRIEDARREGQVARSMEVNSAAVLGAATLTLWFSGPWIFENLRLEVARRMLQIPGLDIQPEGLSHLLHESAGLLLKLMAPLLLIVAAFGLLANLIQVGPLLTAKPLMPDAGRINPLKGLKNLFSARSFAELIKSLLKIALVSLAVGLVLRAEWPELRLLSAVSPQLILGATGSAVLRVLAAALAMLLALALADLVFQR